MVKFVAVPMSIAVAEAPLTKIFAPVPNVIFLVFVFVEESKEQVKENVLKEIVPAVSVN